MTALAVQTPTSEDYSVETFRFDDVARTDENREWDEKRSLEMAADFDLVRAITAGFVVLRRSYPAIVADVWGDGQHRGEAAKLAGLGQEEFAAFVIDVDSPKSEADWVRKLNQGRKPLTARDELHLGLRANDPNVTGAVELAKQHGFILDGATRAGHIAPIKTVLRIYARPNGHIALDRILLCARALSPTSAHIEQMVFTGLDYFWKFHPDCEPRDAARWFAKAGNASAYQARAKGAPGRPAVNIYRDFVTAWNRRSRTDKLVWKR